MSYSCDLTQLPTLSVLWLPLLDLDLTYLLVNRFQFLQLGYCTLIHEYVYIKFIIYISMYMLASY